MLSFSSFDTVDGNSGSFQLEVQSLISDSSPFAQNEVMSVAALCNSNPSLSAVVVSMGSEKEAVEWFERIGGNEFQDKSRVVLISDYNRVQYAAWGLQLLSYSQLCE